MEAGGESYQDPYKILMHRRLPSTGFAIKLSTEEKRLLEERRKNEERQWEETYKAVGKHLISNLLYGVKESEMGIAAVMSCLASGTYKLEREEGKEKFVMTITIPKK